MIRLIPYLIVTIFINPHLTISVPGGNIGQVKDHNKLVTQIAHNFDSELLQDYEQGEGSVKPSSSRNLDSNKVQRRSTTKFSNGYHSLFYKRATKNSPSQKPLPERKQFQAKPSTPNNIQQSTQKVYGTNNYNKVNNYNNQKYTTNKLTEKKSYTKVENNNFNNKIYNNNKAVNNRIEDNRKYNNKFENIRKDNTRFDNFRKDNTRFDNFRKDNARFDNFRFGNNRFDPNRFDPNRLFGNNRFNPNRLFGNNIFNNRFFGNLRGGFGDLSRQLGSFANNFGFANFFQKFRGVGFFQNLLRNLPNFRGFRLGGLLQNFLPGGGFGGFGGFGDGGGGFGDGDGGGGGFGDGGGIPPPPDDPGAFLPPADQGDIQPPPVDPAQGDIPPLQEDNLSNLIQSLSSQITT